jgi:hypothetical protein
LARKGIKDPEGKDIAFMLRDNSCLLKLELEGNLLGSITARELGEALKKNKTLKYLDLDNNYLTNGGQDNDGVFKFQKCLFKNVTLLSLSMANNAMGPLCGEKFEEATEANTTLINFEFGLNPFTLEQIRKIQDNLKRNKAAYDNERMREWRERMLMSTEEEAMSIKVTGEQERKIRDEEAEELSKAREAAREEIWKQMLYEAEIERQQLIQRLEESSKMRAERGKGKKKKPKKAKKP